MSLEVVILAAGKGKRMNSQLPKVLHKVANKPMLFHVIETAFQLSPSAIHIVVGHKSELIEEALKDLPCDISRIVQVSHQKELLGTGDAVASALPKINEESDVLVLYGDNPLTPLDDIQRLTALLEDNPLCVLSAYARDPFGYGRIVRNEEGFLKEIVEEKDASEQIRKIKEINSGIMVTTAKVLRKYLPMIKNDNNQGEYYLTDLAGILVKENKIVDVLQSSNFDLLTGVNSKPQLAFAERTYQSIQANKLLAQGVTLADPNRFDLRGSLKCGQDVFIDINCIFQGNVTLGNNVQIGARCVIKHCTIDDDSIISPYTIMEDSTICKKNTIGPFARLRPGNVLNDEVHVGNFVEVKKSTLGVGTKSGHLSYLGDAVIGKNVNIGAGTITCNYDGANKFKTVIGDDVFVGSDSQLVAPVEIKNGVTIAAGTTVTKHTQMDENSLILTRAQSVKIDSYVRPTKKK